MGGYLYLTPDKLVFKPHVMSAQRSEEVIVLSEIESMKKGCAMFPGFIPLCPNALVLRMKNGSEHRFTVWFRSRWLNVIFSRMISGK